MSDKVENRINTLFATLLSYPWDEVAGLAAKTIEVMTGHTQYPQEAINEVKVFADEIEKISLDDLQGIYSYTFEIASGEFSLDIGYHLHDGFKRANALVSLKELYKSRGFPYDKVAKGELADNLTVLLRFFDFTEEESLRNELRESFLVRGLEQLNKNFDLKPDTETPYRHLLKALGMMVEADLKSAELLAGRESFNA